MPSVVAWTFPQQSDIYWYCGAHRGTLLHVFWECPIFLAFSFGSDPPSHGVCLGWNNGLPEWTIFKRWQNLQQQLKKRFLTKPKNSTIGTILNSSLDTNNYLAKHGGRQQFAKLILCLVINQDWADLVTWGLFQTQGICGLTLFPSRLFYHLLQSLPISLGRKAVLPFLSCVSFLQSNPLDTL